MLSLFAGAKREQGCALWTKHTEINAKLADWKSVYRWEWTKMVSRKSIIIH